MTTTMITLSQKMKSLVLLIVLITYNHSGFIADVIINIIKSSDGTIQKLSIREESKVLCRF